MKSVRKRKSKILFNGLLEIRGVVVLVKKQKPAKINVSAGFSGAPRRIRIPSLLIRSQMLYPVELWALKQERIYAHRKADASVFFKKFAFLIKILAKAQDVGTFNRYPHFKTKRKKKIAQFSYS